MRSIPADVVSGPELALLVESTDAGVMQILSRGASSPPISTDNAIVLSSRQPGRAKERGGAGVCKISVFSLCEKEGIATFGGP